MKQENLYAGEGVIRTVSGIYINVFEPKESYIDINDIAHALSCQPRFGGHLRYFYPVAMHSVCCSEFVEKGYELEALLHDASEAYLLDIPSPIKCRLSNYKEIEDNLMAIISKKFGFNYPLSQQVKDVDKKMLENEWDAMVVGDIMQIDISPSHAKRAFLERYNFLTN